MAREIELKFDLEPATADRILGHPLLTPDPFEAPGPKHLNAIYFDTPDQALRQAGLTLRIRDDGRGRVQTVKAEAGDDGLLGRGEWETPLDGNAPDLQGAAESPL